MGYSEKVVRRQVANLANAGLVERRGELRPVYAPHPAARNEIGPLLRGRGALPDGPRQPRDETGLGLDPRLQDA